MSSIVLCLLLSCFTFHLGFVHPLQDVALYPMSSIVLSAAFLFHLSPRLCPSTVGCIPPSMSSIVLCCFPVSPFTRLCQSTAGCILHQCLPLSSVCLLSCFTFHLGFVHPLQDVSLHQCLPLSSVCCFRVPGGSLLPCYVVLPSSAWSSS